MILIDPRVEIRVLNPPDPFFNGSGNDIDNNSIVLKITYNDFSMILPGDVQKIAEETLLISGIDAEVMLAAHHGDIIFMDLIDFHEKEKNDGPKYY